MADIGDNNSNVLISRSGHAIEIAKTLNEEALKEQNRVKKRITEQSKEEAPLFSLEFYIQPKIDITSRGGEEAKNDWKKAATTLPLFPNEFGLFKTPLEERIGYKLEFLDQGNDGRVAEPIPVTMFNLTKHTGLYLDTVPFADHLWELMDKYDEAGVDMESGARNEFVKTNPFYKICEDMKALGIEAHLSYDPDMALQENLKKDVYIYTPNIYQSNDKVMGFVKYLIDNNYISHEDVKKAEGYQLDPENIERHLANIPNLKTELTLEDITTPVINSTESYMKMGPVSRSMEKHPKPENKKTADAPVEKKSIIIEQVSDLAGAPKRSLSVKLSEFWEANKSLMQKINAEHTIINDHQNAAFNYMFQGYSRNRLVEIKQKHELQRPDLDFSEENQNWLRTENYYFANVHNRFTTFINSLAEIKNGLSEPSETNPRGITYGELVKTYPNDILQHLSTKTDGADLSYIKDESIQKAFGNYVENVKQLCKNFQELGLHEELHSASKKSIIKM